MQSLGAALQARHQGLWQPGQRRHGAASGARTAALSSTRAGRVDRLQQGQGVAVHHRGQGRVRHLQHCQRRVHHLQVCKVAARSRARGAQIRNSGSLLRINKGPRCSWLGFPSRNRCGYKLVALLIEEQLGCGQVRPLREG